MLSSPHSDQQLSWLEPKNFTNLIHMHQDDLRRIEAGKPPVNMSLRIKKKLIRLGVFTKKKKKRTEKLRYRLTPRAINELYKLEVKKNV